MIGVRVGWSRVAGEREKKVIGTQILTVKVPFWAMIGGCGRGCLEDYRRAMEGLIALNFGG